MPQNEPDKKATQKIEKLRKDAAPSFLSFFFSKGQARPVTSLPWDPLPPGSCFSSKQAPAGGRFLNGRTQNTSRRRDLSTTLPFQG